MKKDCSEKTQKWMLAYQKAELEGYIVYSQMAKYEKEGNNQAILQQIALEEKEHASLWQNLTGEEVQPSRIKIIWYNFLFHVLGYTFVMKLMEKKEKVSIPDLMNYEKEVPEIHPIISVEERHEEQLAAMLDEERLQYVGAIVLGLNDALVELTGTIAGLTFALSNTRLIALSGIITGFSATFSMAASNYLAERADGNPNALKSSIYTGVAYLITVVFLVLPFLLFPQNMYGEALAVMLLIVIAIIVSFNYYISVAKTLPFWRRFGEMAVISLGTALLSFFIGIVAKKVLGIDI